MTIAEKALSIVGMTRDQLGLHESTEWCAETVSYILKCTVDPRSEVKSISCNNMLSLMRHHPEWYEPDDMLRISDVLFIDHDRDRDPLKDTLPLDHIAIVVQIDDDGTVWYVDGNGDSSGKVQKRSRHISTFDFNCDYPDYYMRYRGNIATESADQAEIGEEVRIRTVRNGGKASVQVYSEEKNTWTTV